MIDRPNGPTFKKKTTLTVKKKFIQFLNKSLEVSAFKGKKGTFVDTREDLMETNPNDVDYLLGKNCNILLQINYFFSQNNSFE